MHVGNQFSSKFEEYVRWGKNTKEGLIDSCRREASILRD